MNLAPNGKPSNLTDEQYKLVRTTAFKKWFGNWENSPESASKVVDENGEPLVVYHRNKKKFNVFDTDKQLNGWLGKGFYFSESKSEFKDYGKIIISTFLNIKNPFAVKGESPSDFLYELKQKFGINEFDATKVLKENKCDGVIYKHWDYEGKMLSCFEPNQIKLADGTNTTFDANNPDIRYKDGGATKTYRNKFNIKYGFDKNESHSLAEISKLTKLKLSSLQDIYNKGIGAYKTNPQSVRPNVKSKEQWAMARVYSAVMGGKAAKVDANELAKGKMEKGGLILQNLKKHLKEFSNKEFYEGTKYSDISTSCDLSKGNCYDISEELYDFLKQKGYKDLSLVEVKKPKFDLTDAHYEWQPSITEYSNIFHIILKVNNYFIDFTGIQYSKEDIGLKIYTEKELKQRWGKISYFDKYKTGGNVNEFVIGKTYTGKEVKGIVSKYGSREGTDMNEFADEEINEDDKYILENVEISDLLQKDVNLKDYIKDELENYKKGNKITEPILLGNDPFSMEKNVVRDGFGRTTQTIANGEKTILAFVKTSNKYKDGGATTAFTYTIGGL